VDDEDVLAEAQRPAACRAALVIFVNHEYGPHWIWSPSASWARAAHSVNSFRPTSFQELPGPSAYFGRSSLHYRERGAASL
jgi:hypothetical protein